MRRRLSPSTRRPRRRSPILVAVTAAFAFAAALSTGNLLPSAGGASSASAASSPATVAPGDPVAPSVQYNFSSDTGQTVTDTSGNGNNGTWTGTPSYVAGPDTGQQAMAFSGGLDFVSLPRTATTEPTAGSMAVEFWYKETSESQDGAIFGNNNWNSGSNPGMLVYNLYGTTGLSALYGGGPARSTDLADATCGWNYVSVVVNGDNQTMTTYVDGNPVATEAWNGDTEALDSGLPFNIGTDGDEITLNGDYPGSWASGDVADFDYYNQAISSSQVASDFAATEPSGFTSCGVDPSATSGWSVSAPTTTATEGGSLTFDWNAATATSSGNWIGLYQAGQTPGTDSSSAWQYLSDATSGSTTLALGDDTSGTGAPGSTAGTASGQLAPGNYVAYLFDGSGHTVAAQEDVAIVAPWSITTADGDTAQMGGSTTFDWTAATATTDGNWIGIYQAGQTPGTASGDSPASAWSYLPDDTSGSTTLSLAGTTDQSGAPGTTAGSTSQLTPGDYVAYLFDGSGYTVAASIDFEIEGHWGLSIAGGATSFVTGTNITFDWTAGIERDPSTDGNWIGVYQQGQTPGDVGSTLWQYIPDSYSGTTTMKLGAATGTGNPGSTSGTASANLSPGTYVAYLFNGDEYTIAQQVTFTVTPIPPPPAGNPTTGFLVHAWTLPSTDAGSPVSQALGGLWWNSTPTSFTKVAGSSWLGVSSTGTVTGTAPRTAAGQSGTITVQGTDGTTTSTLTLVVPVRAAGAAPQLTAATWNLDNAGNGYTDGQAKEIEAIAGGGLDLVGLQGTDGTAAASLARALGWQDYQSSGDLGLISPYPISDVTAPTTSTPAVGATLDVDGEHVRVWVTDLDASNFGPTLACSSTPSTAAQIVASEKASTRYAQAQAVAQAMASDLARARTTPVLLLGDLASPSGQDWTAANAANNCNVGAVDWPVPDVFRSAGLFDSYRQAYPNPVKDPGTTWSLTGTGPSGVPAQRIDYVEYRGGLHVIDSEAYFTGAPSGGSAAGDNQWPSDHAAAVTYFQLPPIHTGWPDTTTPANSLLPARTTDHR